MKLTQNKNTKAIKSGMTLLELTVVILVLLSLIAILFIGARAWKAGSDKAGCIMNIRNVQQAVRGHQNMNNTTAIPATTVIFTSATYEGYLTAPTCPASGAAYTYATAGVGPLAPGSLFAACGNADATVAATHIPANYGTW